MALKYDNFAKGQISGSHSAAATSFTLVTGHAARFPTFPRKCVVWEASAWDDPADAFNDTPTKAEIVLQNAAPSGDVLPTIVRAQEGTTALDMTDTSKIFNIMGVATREFYRSQIAWTNVQAHGAVGDGVTDDSLAVIAALDAVTDGGTVYFPLGTYNLATWPAAGKSYTKRMKLLGESESIIKGPATSHFLAPQDDLWAESVEFSGWDVIFELDSITTAIKFLRLSSIRSAGAKAVVRWDTPGALASIDNIAVENCEFLTTVNNVIDIQGLWGSARCVNNYVSGGIRAFAFGTDTQTDEDDWRRIHILGNTVRDLVSTGVQPALAVVRGREVVIADNVLDGASGGTVENWGIHAKARRLNIHENIIRGVTGGSTGPTGILLAGADRSKTLGAGAGPSGFNIICRGNQVDMGAVANSVGIRLLTEDTICDGNILEACAVAGITTLGDNVQLEHLQITRNKIHDGAASSRGIRILNGGNHWLVQGNIIFNHEIAIEYAPTAATLQAFAPLDIQIKDNVLIDGTLGTHGIKANVDTTKISGTVKYLQIKGNYVAGMLTRWLSFDAGTYDFVWVGGNHLNGNGASDAILFTVTPTNLIQELDAGGSIQLGGGAWNTQHFVFANAHLWVDSTGDLRIKATAPTSDLDGVVVGTQT